MTLRITRGRWLGRLPDGLRNVGRVVNRMRASSGTGRSTRRSMSHRMLYECNAYFQTRLALPWKTFCEGLIWIIQMVSPCGGSTKILNATPAAS